MVKGNDLAKKSLKPLLWSLAIPSIIAQLVNVIYNMVDRIYIGNMADGTVAMAGLSVALPVVTIIMAFTQLVGTGGAPLAAIALGRQNKEEAEEIMTNSFVSLIVSGVLLTVIMYVFQEPLLYLFGADEQTIVPAMQYVSIYLLGTVFVQIALGMNSYITTQGYAKMGMATVVLGAVLNIILDPIFIFVFDMGVSGAALATILSQGVSAVWVIIFFMKKSDLKLRAKYSRVKFKVLLNIMALGISPFIMTITESFLQIAFNNQLSLYGGSMAVATMAILASLFQLLKLPIHGFALGAQPVLSYNYGAKNYQRIRETLAYTIKIALLYSVIGTLLMLFFAPLFVRIFSSDPETIEFASWSVRVYMAGSIIFGAQLACQQAFLSFGQAKLSLSMAICRKIVLLIPLMYILPDLLSSNSFVISFSEPIMELANDGSKVFGVLFSESVADFLAAVITSSLFYRFYKQNLCEDLKVK